MSELKEILKKKWYLQGLNATPLLIFPCGNSGFFLNRWYDTSFRWMVYYFKDDFVQARYNREDASITWSYWHDKYKQDKEYFSKIRKKYITCMNDHCENLKKFDQQIGEKDQLWISFKEIFDAAFDSLGMAYIVEPFTIYSDTVLSQKNFSATELAVLCTPLEPSWLQKQQEELYEISLIEDKEKQEKEIAEHAQKYYWIENSYSSATPLKVDHFKQQMKTMKKPLDAKNIRQEKQEILKEFSEEERELVKLIEFFAQFQDERKRYILITLHYLELFAKEIENRFDIPCNLVKYAVPGEINADFFSQEKVKELLEERRKGCFIFSSEKGDEVFIGSVAQELLSVVEQKDQQGYELRGMSASLGSAAGRVVVCNTPESLKKVEQGDILVASMTRPEYFPAMKKAAAVVTDEGGVTCHAAIVCRELQIPCIIATKQATTFFNTGDFVEVLAHHGVVRKVKNGHRTNNEG